MLPMKGDKLDLKETITAPVNEALSRADAIQKLTWEHFPAKPQQARNSIDH